MAQDSKIEWTHHTANLWWGCTEVHSGCDNCYARVLSHRWNHKLWGNDAPRRMINSTFNDLAKYQKLAAAAGEMHRVFVGSMMDIFEKPMMLVDTKGAMITDGMHEYPTYTEALRDQLFEEITEGKYPDLLFLLLTKRPSNINKMIPKSWLQNPPSNVMYGTSPVDQATANILIPQLLQVNGKRFLSVEPQLGPIDFSLVHCERYKVEGNRCTDCYYRTSAIRNCDSRLFEHIHWIIQGGESGQKKRPFNLEWARLMRDQCQEAGIPYFFKQIDKVQQIPADLMIRQFPN